MPNSQAFIQLQRLLPAVDPLLSARPHHPPHLSKQLCLSHMSLTDLTQAHRQEDYGSLHMSLLSGEDANHGPVWFFLAVVVFMA